MADDAAVEVARVAKPTQSVARGQGFQMSQEARVAIERHAMAVAQAWLEEQQYTVEDRSRKESFDLLASRSGECLKVEVKGTTAEYLDALFMTRNEVLLHKKERGRTALLAVTHIRLKPTDSGIAADGGRLTAMVGWDIDAWDVEPIAYQLRRR
jgi:hypothetical protein